jgi:hypothetical protein
VLSVAVDEVWISRCIYWALTERNYSLTELRTSRITVTTARMESFQPLLGSSFQWRTFLLLWVPELSPASATSFSLFSTNSTPIQLKFKVMLLSTVSRPIFLGVKPPSAAEDQIFATIRQLQVC